jgi:hypothetical protein
VDSDKQIPGDARNDKSLVVVPRDGHLSFRKVAKNFGQHTFLSACEIEHGRFRALFAGMFCPKIHDGRTSPKSKKN